jgi:PilZ domain
MTPDGLERRHTKRRQSFAEHGIVSARVRPGIDASVVDVSPAGALIETRHRLLPGSSVEISFAQDVRLPAVRGKVLRCAVALLGADTVHYRGAILFDRWLPWLSDDSSHGYSVPGCERRRAYARWVVTTQMGL